MSQERNAVVLLSGGMDSAVCAALAGEAGFRLFALTVRYGQRHAVELTAAAAIAQRMGVYRHLFQTLDLRAFGGSSLTDDTEVPNSDTPADERAQIPSTYVPARNTIFLSLALALAEVAPASDLFLGVNAVDYSGYPDCRPEFINAFERLAQLATRAGVQGRRVTIHAPLLRMSKADIVREGLRLGVDFSLTHSCYDPTPQGLACGRCDSCVLRSRGFAQAGAVDPVSYA